MANNASAYAALDRIADALRMSEHLDEDVAKDVRGELESTIAGNIAAQRDPYGHAWQPAKDDLPLLVNAAKAVSVTRSGTTIAMTVTGPEARHHIGNARGYHGGSAKLGGFRRTLIPFKSLPGPFIAVIRKVLQRRFALLFKEAA
jgi:hypothetical protein